MPHLYQFLGLLPLGVTGSNAVYYGDGQYLENVIRGFGLNKNGSLVGFGVTYLDLGELVFLPLLWSNCRYCYCLY